MAAVLPALLPRQLIGARRRPACRVRGPAGAAASQRLCRAARVLSGAEVRGTRLGRARASKQPTSTPAPLCQASSDNTSSVFLDIEVNGEAVGRLNIRLENDVAPMSCRNFEMLCTGQMRNEDPLFSLKGCKFERFKGKYAHTCKGRGANINGKKFVENEALVQHRHETPGAGGGVYYGVKVDLTKDPSCTVLAVPISGPGFGSSRFTIFRVGGSPSSLQQRILANYLVIGTVTDGIDILAGPMARSDASVVIADCGAAG